MQVILHICTICTFVSFALDLEKVLLLCTQYLCTQQLFVCKNHFSLGFFSKQMVIPIVKGITKMGVSENAKKGMNNGKEIARVKIFCTFQLIWIATFPTPTPSKNNRHGCLEVILSLKPQVVWLSAPQTAALFTLPKWCIKMCHSVMAVLDCATTHMSIGTNMLQGSQMWHSTQFN